MEKNDYAITFACYNQLGYTKRCVDSLLATGVDLSKVIAVDNGSSDGTREYLISLDLGGCILNKKNLGCGAAWNQGTLALQAEWTVIMNNDVLATQGWLDGLIGTAQKNGLNICSPALVEGELDYDLDSFTEDARERMRYVLHHNDSHAICLVVHHSVWQEIGYFLPVPKLFGYEDTLFFDEARKAKIPMGITGASWLHHFGSITQKAMKQERGLANKEDLANRALKRRLRQPWLQRKLWRMYRHKRKYIWSTEELSKYGMTLHGVREDNNFKWL